MTPGSAKNSEIPKAPDPPTGKQHATPAQVFRSKVYRAQEDHSWIVEPPRDVASSVNKIVFTGPRAQQLALTYAYETYGNARFFPY